MNQDTFGAYLDVASSHRLQRLEAKCIDFLLANFDKVAFSCFRADAATHDAHRAGCTIECAAAAGTEHGHQCMSDEGTPDCVNMPHA